MFGLTHWFFNAVCKSIILTFSHFFFYFLLQFCGKFGKSKCGKFIVDHISTYITVAVALDRYLAIYRPEKVTNNRTRVKNIVSGEFLIIFYFVGFSQKYLKLFNETIKKLNEFLFKFQKFQLHFYLFKF
jgi:hypothetical protein